MAQEDSLFAPHHRQQPPTTTALGFRCFLEAHHSLKATISLLPDRVA